jgi:sugar lactone lactonase YvrE
LQPEIECVVQCADILGEVPLWCSRTRKLWWVDVRRPCLQSYDPATHAHQAIRLPDGMVTGSIALREAGGFLLATGRGFYTYDPASLEPPFALMNPEPDKPENRLNDGKCDRRGRFWVGSMRDGRREPDGGFYRYDPDHSCHFQFDQVVVPNSVCFSPDDRTMYFADTYRHTIWAYDFDLNDGVISNRRVFKDWTAQGGRPDGSTVDADGCLWNAMVGVGQVLRYTPDGLIDRVIQLPISNATCPAFGGDNLDILFVTSHSQRITPEKLATEPCAGGLFAINAGVKGLPEPRFGG